MTGLTQNVEDHDHYLFQHDERIEKLEKEKELLSKTVEEQGKEINDLKTRLEKLEKKK